MIGTGRANVSSQGAGGTPYNGPRVVDADYQQTVTDLGQAGTPTPGTVYYLESKEFSVAAATLFQVSGLVRHLIDFPGLAGYPTGPGLLECQAGVGYLFDGAAVTIPDPEGDVARLQLQLYAGQTAVAPLADQSGFSRNLLLPAGGGGGHSTVRFVLWVLPGWSDALTPGLNDTTPQYNVHRELAVTQTTPPGTSGPFDPWPGAG